MPESQKSWKFPAAMALWVCLAVDTPCLAQAKPAGPVKMSFVPLVTRARSQAPVPLTVKLSYEGFDVLRGDLNLEISLGDRLVHQVQVPELALTHGEQRFRMLVPEVIVPSLSTPVRARATFQGVDRRLDLGEHDIVMPADFRRNLACAVIRLKDRPQDQTQIDLVDSLLLHRFAPEDEARRIDFVVNPSLVTPPDLPASPALFCGLDLVVLEGSGLAALAPEQCAALARWIEAGGSLCVQPPERGLLRHHLEFLNQLSPTADEPLYSLNFQKELELMQPAATGYRLTRPGLGRAVILEDVARISPILESRAWDKAVCFLWKLRLDQWQTIERTATRERPGVWIPPARENPMSGSTMSWENSQFPYSPRGSLESLSTLASEMRPEQVKGVPLGTLLAILVLFLLTVAPGDYFLLGWLKLRRYTWWLLPVTSIAFTWLTAAIANRTLGDRDYRAVNDLVDVGEQGTVVRTTRFEMVFAARPREHQVTLHDRIYVNLTDADSEASARLASDMRQRGAYAEAVAGSQLRREDLPQVSGRLPFDFTVRQKLRQWSPVVTRQTQVGNESSPGRIDWKKLRDYDWNTDGGRDVVFREIRAAIPTAIALFINTNGVAFDGDRRISADLESFLVNTTFARRNVGYFAVVSQVGPSGHSNLEDLRILDPSQPGEVVLAVIVPDGTDKVIYRMRRTVTE